jgi:hypothetical protein
MEAVDDIDPSGLLHAGEHGPWPVKREKRGGSQIVVTRRKRATPVAHNRRGRALRRCTINIIHRPTHQ